MKSFYQILKMISLRKCLLALTFTFLFGFLLWSQDVVDYFKPECTITTIGDVARCQKKNKYVKVTFDTIYRTGYAYTTDNIETGLFVDIDLDGYSLIAVVPIREEKALFEGKQKTVHGTLELFHDDAMVDGYHKIKQKYLQDFKDDATEEEILGMFIPYQLNAYNGQKSNQTISILVFLIPLVIAFGFFCYHFYYFLKPDKRKIYGKKDVSFDEITKIEEEYQKKEKLYEKKPLMITDHYLIQKTAILLKANKIENIVWIYEHVVKQYGREVSRSFIICFNDGTSMAIVSNRNEYDTIQEILREKNDHILYGYKPEYQKLWKQNPSLKKES